MAKETEDIQNQIASARFAIDTGISLINLADTKAGILLGISGIVIALLFAVDKGTIPETGQVLFLITGVLFGVSSFFSVLTVLPRKNKYVEKMNKFSEDEFVSSSKGITLTDQLDENLRFLHNLFRIQSRKYLHVKLATIMIIIAIAFLIASLFSFMLTTS